MNTITIKNQTLSYLGDASMLLCPMTSFLCSHRVPEGVANAIRQWVNGLDSIRYVKNRSFLLQSHEASSLRPLR